MKALRWSVTAIAWAVLLGGIFCGVVITCALRWALAVYGGWNG